MLKFTIGPNESLAERLQVLAPKANIVKAFNSVGASRMVNPRYEQGLPYDVYVCGNSPEAKRSVGEVLPTVRLGAIRLRRHCRRARHRALMQAVVYAGLPPERVGACLQAADSLKAASEGAADLSGLWRP